MSAENLREKLRSGGIVYSTMLFMTQNPRWIKPLSQLGFDAIIIDNEHAPYSRSEVASLVTALETFAVTPIVRIPYPAASLVTMAIDAGAQGILTPYCETASQAREVIAAARLRPIKGALRQQMTEGDQMPNRETQAYLRGFNRDPFMMIGVESVPAVENLEAILQVEGIDTIFIGPHDLTISMGIPNQYQHPDYEATLRHIIAACSKRQVPVTIHLSTADSVIKWVKEGARFVLYRSDTRAMIAGYSQGLNSIRKRVAE